MIKVIIDTNVLISAALRGRDPEAIVLFIVSSPNFEWVVSEEILLEYKSVLDRKKLKLSDEIKQKWLRIFDTFTTVIDVNITIDFPRDPKDAKFLECAIASKAKYFITGDRDFTEPIDLEHTQIISVSQFRVLIT
jgi:putative PIN family toxin of toxin-antitoxin system